MNTVFDQPRTLQRFLGNGELLARATAIFLAQAPQLADRLEACIAAGDGRGAREQAHALRGAASTVGAVQVARLALEVEEQPHELPAGAPDEVRAALARFARAAAAAPTA